MSVQKKSLGKFAKSAPPAAKKPAAKSVASLRAGSMRKMHLKSVKLFEPPDPC